MGSADHSDPLRRSGGLTVVLVRHGRTAWNAEGRFLGVSDVPLDDAGRAEAAKLGSALAGRVDAVYSSPLSRALQTAEAVHPSPWIESDLRELDQGRLEGLVFSEAVGRYPAFFQAWSADPEVAVPPGGESLDACRRRVRGVLDAVAVRHPPGAVVAVVSHQLALASALCAMAGSPLREWRSHRLGNCGVAVVVTDGTTWTISRSPTIVDNLGIATGSALPGV